MSHETLNTEPHTESHEAMPQKFDHLSWLDDKREFELGFTETEELDKKYPYRIGRLVINKGQQRLMDLADLLKNHEGSFYVLMGRKLESSAFDHSIRIDETELRLDPKNIFVALHELAHVERGDVEAEDQMRARAKLDEYALSLSRKHFNKKELKEMSEEVVLDERETWAQTIKFAREIKKESGLDLFKLFKDKDDFLGWIRVSSLLSYERGLKYLGGEKPTKLKLVRQQRMRQTLKHIKSLIPGVFKS